MKITDFILENIFEDSIKEEWNEYIDSVIDEYTINATRIKVDDHEIEVWCYDDDLATLFDDFGINIGKVVHCENVFDYDEDTYEPVGLNYGDYIETVELHQYEKTYLCKAYCAHNGCGADYAFALFDIKRIERGE